MTRLQTNTLKGGGDSTGGGLGWGNEGWTGATLKEVNNTQITTNAMVGGRVGA